MATYAENLVTDEFLPFYDDATCLVKAHTAATVMRAKEGNLRLDSKDVTLAVLSNTSNTAFQVTFETVPFEQSGVAWSIFHTMNFGDDGGVAAPKFQTITIPGKFGKIRATLVSITGGSVEIYIIA
jgi:hypothetical protein